MSESILEKVRSAAVKRLLYQIRLRKGSVQIPMFFPPHHPITSSPHHTGHSCLILGGGEDGRLIHVVCAPKPDYLAIITAYIPDVTQWSPDLKRRI